MDICPGIENSYESHLIIYIHNERSLTGYFISINGLYMWVLWQLHTTGGYCHYIYAYSPMKSNVDTCFGYANSYKNDIKTIYHNKGSSMVHSI